MRSFLAGFLCLGLLLFGGHASAYFPRGGQGPLTTPGCPKGTGLTDLGGTTDACASSTLNPSYQLSDAFTNTTTGFRQSGQSAYFYSDASLNYNIACIDNGCGYDTTKLVFDPANESFTATTASITAGVLYVDTTTLGTGGNPYTGQTLSGAGITANTVHVTTNVDATHWNTDGGAGLNISTETITGQQHPQINCFYYTSNFVSTVPIVYCQTGTDTTTANTFDGYNWSLHGGVWLDIAKGGSGDGTAGSVTITNGKFVCNTTNNYTRIVTGTGTHFNIYIRHNQDDGGYSSGCTGGSFANLNNQGVASGNTCTTTYDEYVEWNAVINEPNLPVSSVSNCMNVHVDRNAFPAFNLTGAYHGAVFADSVAGPMGDYEYTQNTCIYPSSSPSGLGSTCFSVLGKAGTTNIFLQNVSILGNIAISNLSGGLGGTASNAVCIWENLYPASYASLTMGGNLVDGTGCSFGNVKGGLSGSIATASEQANATAHNTTATVTAISGWWPNQGIMHVNNTPYTWNGTITYNGDGATGTMTLDAPNSSLAAGMGVQGITVPRDMEIQSKTDSSHFVVVNYDCSYTSTCTSANIAAPHQAMYSACSTLPYGTVDPNTGVASTGTGFNTGTYILACEQTDISRSTYNRYNPAIAAWPPTVNGGTDHSLLTGASIYLGGDDWQTGVAP